MNVDGVILAAGYSKRTGDFKPGLDLCGKPILIRTIESMFELCEKIIVVAGHKYENIYSLVSGIPKLKVVKNEHFELGMFSSVRIGLKEVQSNRFFILPGDQPAVRTQTFQTLLDIEDDIVIPRYKGKKGHPALFNSRLIPEILSWPDSEILRNYIHSKNKVKIIDIDDPGIGLDVDTAEDHEKIIKYYKDVFEK
ncbi:MAG: nucleotidyltransferase family protein [Candidatus Marinimicrobia bacterium]|nr:nucleotidyltransferase family protein [Candidatus Neomarinimicrobiota bacterium]